MNTLPKLRARLDKYEINRDQRHNDLVGALLRSDGNISEAAFALKLSRQRVTVLVKEFGLGDSARKLRRAARQRSR